jgi:hypothetical protein
LPAGARRYCSAHWRKAGRKPLPRTAEGKTGHASAYSRLLTAIDATKSCRRDRLWTMQPETSDDALTLSALGIIAFILADVTHEAMGHGLMSLVVGAKPVLLTTCYFTAQGNSSQWIPAAGGLANLCVGVLSLALLHTTRLRLRYFLILLAAFNLFFATGYPAYSGIALFGDWAAVTSGLQPAWLWRVLLVAISIGGYFLSMLLIARAIRPFCGSREPQALRRLRRITLIPYLAAIAAAFLGGIPNSSGWLVIFTAAVPAAAASFGLTQMDHFTAATTSPSGHIPAEGIERSGSWIAAAVVVLAVFVAVLGPGIRFH